MCHQLQAEQLTVQICLLLKRNLIIATIDGIARDTTIAISERQKKQRELLNDFMCILIEILMSVLFKY